MGKFKLPYRSKLSQTVEMCFIYPVFVGVIVKDLHTTSIISDPRNSSNSEIFRIHIDFFNDSVSENENLLYYLNGIS